jgi:hypothetical protein
MPWSELVAHCRGWVGGTHYVPKTGLGGFDWVIPGPNKSNPHTGRCRRANIAAYAKANAAATQSAPETAHAAE